MAFSFLFLLVFLPAAASAGPADSRIGTVALAGPGEQFTGFAGRPVINDDGDVTFFGTVRGAVGSVNGIWTAFGPVAVAGDIAPGLEVGGEPARFGGRFGIPLLDSKGVVVFGNDVGGSTLWSAEEDGDGGYSLGLLVKAEDIFAGSSTFSVTPPVINPDGVVAFVTLGATPGIFKAANNVSLAGEEAPDGQGELFTSFGAPVINPQGDTAFHATIEGGKSGVWKETGSALRLIALEGDLAPGAPVHPEEGPGRFTRIEDPVINAAGETAFHAEIAPAHQSVDEGIWKGTSPGDLAPAVLRGGKVSTPSGEATLFDLGAPVLTGSGEVIFVALTVEGFVAICRAGGGGVASIVTSEEPAPGTNGHTFGQFRPPAVNQKGHVAFFTTTRNPDTGAIGQGLFAHDVAGQLVDIVKVGDTIEVRENDRREVQGIGFENGSRFGTRFGTGPEDGRMSGFNVLNQVAFLASFTDGTSGIFLTDFEPAPPGKDFVWSGACLTDSWWESCDGFTNWNDRAGTPLAEPPGERGDEVVIIEDADVVILDPILSRTASIASLEATGSLGVLSALALGEDSTIEAMTLDTVRGLTTNGRLLLTGESRWTDGDIGGSGTLAVRGRLTVDGVGGLTGRTIAVRLEVIDGTVVVDSRVRLAGGGLYTEDSRFEFPGLSGIVLDGGTHVFRNGPRLIPSPPLHSDGLELRSGTLSIEGEPLPLEVPLSIVGGTVSGDASLTLEEDCIWSGGDIAVTGGVTNNFRGALGLRIEPEAPAEVVLKTTLENNGRVTQRSRFQLIDATIQNSGEYELVGNERDPATIVGGDSSVLLNEGTFISSGFFNREMESTIQTRFSNAGKVLVESRVTLVFEGPVDQVEGRGEPDGSTLTGGEWELEPEARILIPDAFFARNNGTITLARDSSFENLPGDVVSFENNGVLNLLDSTISPRGDFVNDGSMSLVRSELAGTADKRLENNGTIVLQDGRLVGSEAPGLFVNTGVITGTGSITGDLENGGVVSGAITLNGSLISNGVLVPGASPGVITVNGDYTQTAGGRLEIEIGGAEAGVDHDQLVVNGTAIIGGTVIVKYLDGFEPAAGGTFEGIVAADLIDDGLSVAMLDGPLVELALADAAGGGRALAVVATDGRRYVGPGGPWERPADWSGGVLPGASDTVLIPGAAASDGGDDGDGHIVVLGPPLPTTVLALVVGSGGDSPPGTATLTLGPGELGAVRGATVRAGGRLTGNGLIAGNLYNDGAVAPGVIAGAIAIGGDYTQSDTAALEIELGGLRPDEHDQLGVAGHATLGGALVVDTLERFVPAEGDEFVILGFDTRNGEFESIENRSPYPGLRFEVVYDGTPGDGTATLAVTSTGGVGPGVDLEIAKLVVKAGKDRNAPRDRFTALGPFTGDESEFTAAESLRVNIGTEEFILFEETIDLAEAELKKGKFSHKGSPGGIKSLTLDFTKGRYAVSAIGVDLGGLAAPVVVEIAYGEFRTIGAADEEIVNGRKLLPLCLLSGYADALRVAKAKVKSGKTGDSLSVKGEIAAADPEFDLGGEAVTINWGVTFSETLPAGSFVRTKGNSFLYKAPRGGMGKIAKAAIDLDRCRFSAAIKNAEALDSAGMVTLEIIAGELAASDTVSF